ncbi:MAG: hypothetical protein K6L74_07610 [Neptuniibacter sp.]
MNVRRLVWNIFPPTELRQFECCAEKLLNSGELRPPLHAYNPLLAIRKSISAMQNKPEQVVSEIRELSIPVEHFVLLKIHHFALETLNSGKFREYGHRLNDQGIEYRRVIRKVSWLLE